MQNANKRLTFCITLYHDLKFLCRWFFRARRSEIGRFFSVCLRCKLLIANWFAVATEFEEGPEGEG